MAAVGLLVALISPAPASASHIGEDLTVDQQAVATTNQLLGALRQYENAPASQKALALQRLTDAATQRRDRMLALLERNPRLAAVRVLPTSVRNRMPAQAQALVEREVGVLGVIQARVEDDFARGRSAQRFEMVDAAGQRFDLSVADASEREMLAMSGKRARVAAVQFDRRLLALDKRSVQLLAADGSTSTSSGGTLAAASTVVQGNQNTLSILVNFTDAALSCTAADVASRLFGATGSTVNNNYKESSGGLVSFSGQAVGPYTINYSASGSCDYLGWAAAAEAAAKAAGIDPSQYARVNYVTPSNATCGWSGLAYMPGRQSWVQSCAITGTFSHELGHNLSFNHAATPSFEYGDGSDPMGGAQVVEHNAANRTMAGWLASGSVQDVSTGGSYALSTISGASLTSSPRVLRLAKPDTSEFYFVSLRQPTGLDATLGTAYLNTLSVHRSTGSLPNRTYLLQNLAVGQSFNDSVNGITIVNQAVNSGTATVGVTIGTATCARNAPVVAVSPASQTSGAGATLAYSVTVTNQNSAACGTSTFNLGQALPSGFTGSLGATSLAIAAGASATTNWSVTSATSVTDATYTLTASAADAATAVATSAHASAVIYTPTTCTRSSPLISVSPSSQSGAAGSTLPYTVTVTNRNSSGCGTSSFNLAGAVPSGFNGTFAAASLSIAAGGTASTTWSVGTASSVAGGTYSLNASTTDASAGTTAAAGASAVISNTQDTTPPTIAITSPAAGATVKGTKTSITASASDASGIQAVEFYVDGVLLARDTGTPYAANWNLRKVAAGTHSIRVRAIDAVGNAAEQAISVTVAK